ncbi:hypothetical protein ACO2Q3_21960 [Caulobacter sp. KR2-114]|uniref:hypothetical protein n=1 Tax=Caulobacter sp. KR2-114 TaxID=3400912 RepID=UPI003C069E44
MILTVCIALFGAALGAFLRPRVLAVMLAAGVSAGVRAGPQFIGQLAGGREDADSWAGAMLRYFESPFTSYLVLIIAGAGAALFAALLCLFLEEKPAEPFWLPKEGDVRRRGRDGRYVRATGMIEERSIHNRAEARVRAAFER